MNKKLNDKYVKLMKETNTGDHGKDHGKADDLLCNLLIELGYQEVVDEYNLLEKWYE